MSGLIGLAGASLGLSYAGIGEFVGQTINTNPDLITTDNTIGNQRAIDFSTGQYMVNADGTFIGVSGAINSVALALKNIKGSASANNIGQTFSQIQTIGDNFLPQITQQVSSALSDLINRQIITIIKVEVIGQNNTQQIIVKWTDLSSNLTFSNII